MMVSGQLPNLQYATVVSQKKKKNIGEGDALSWNDKDSTNAG